MLNFKHQQIGFTLIEIILALLILTIIFSFSAPYYNAIFADREFENTADEMVGALRLAQSRSAQGYRDGYWGVDLNASSPGSSVIFKIVKTAYSVSADNYSARATAFDETVSQSPAEGLSITGISLSSNSASYNEIVFTGPDGQTPNYGSFQIINNDGRSITITIDKFGMIERD